MVRTPSASVSVVWTVGLPINSTPLPNVLSLRDGHLRVLDHHGELLCERKLVDFPDVSNAKLQLESHVEEPGEVRLVGEHFTLFTGAGLYRFRASESPGGGSDSSDKATTIDPNVLRCGWRTRHRHPLETGQNTDNLGFGVVIGFGGIRARGRNNFFPQVRWYDDEIAVLLPSGELFGLDEPSGKLRWRLQSQGNVQVQGPPRRYGRWAYSVRAAPAGALVCDRRTSESRVIAGPAHSGMDLDLLGGGFVALFSGSRVEARLTTEPRVLWEHRSAGRLAFATSRAAWFSGRFHGVTSPTTPSGFRIV